LMCEMKLVSIFASVWCVAMDESSVSQSAPCFAFRYLATLQR
jgi:hypothetical protein